MTFVYPSSIINNIFLSDVSSGTVIYSSSLRKYTQTVSGPSTDRFSFTEDEVIAPNTLIWVSSLMWVKRLWNKNPQEGKKLTSPVQIQAFMKAQERDNSDTWDQLWTSFNIQIIAGKFNSILHITTRLFLRLTEMDVWFRVVHDPV